MEEIRKFILIKLYKSCIASHKELEISQRSMLKAIEFLGIFYVNIEELLLITFLRF